MKKLWISANLNSTLVQREEKFIIIIIIIDTSVKLNSMEALHTLHLQFLSVQHDKKD